MNLTAQDEIAEYVEGVRAALGGVPAATRDELLEDLPEHLAEVLAEGGGSLRARLGTPDVYAAELLASAGVSGAVPRQPAGWREFAELRGRSAAAARRADVRVGPLLGYAKATDFLTLLRPAWWVLRGYLAAMLFAYVFDSGGGPLGLLPRLGGNGIVALLLLGVMVVGSVWLGRRGRPEGLWSRRLMTGGTAFLVLFGLVGFTEVDGDRQDGPAYYETGYSGGGQYADVQDVFVYDRFDRLVEGAQLFDQNGQPIRMGEPFCWNETTGTSPSRNMGYPHCPERAPFRAGDPSASESAVPDPSGDPSPSGAAPSPSESVAASVAPPVPSVAPSGR
ncbi:hypothetical protein [Actinoplanes sp. NBRC 101535]|uniref:HAAS signaling domain-containing protein n=1 Tax=Actinoplanes sp. NBRC 101535 TaxID=3032196 RepID=UPI0024A45DF8|nr:hypothetical protein [Actinoplanes sp. NBRC 101535]GLY01085.1 hypothetical protein Acsp01_14640 [Actinoplanes sp. NBRC 101535]